MLHSDKYRARLERYLSALSEAEPNAAAWRKAFGDVPLGTLQADFDGFVSGGNLEVRARSYVAGPLQPPTVRTMSDGEYHLMRVRLTAWTRETFARVERDLAEARRLLPGSPEVAYWAGRLAHVEKKWFEAEDELTDAAQAAPRDERFHLALAELHYDRVVKEQMDLVQRGRVARVALADGLEKMEPEVRALGKLARAPESLSFIARYHAELGRGKTALPFAEAAVKADPTCAPCLDTLAGIVYGEGRIEEAVWLEERALAMLPENEVDAGMADRLERYRESAKRNVSRETPSP